MPLTERLILQERKSSSRGVVYSVNDAFRQGLRNALTGGYICTSGSLTTQWQ